MDAPHLSVEQRCRVARGLMDCLTMLGIGTPIISVTEERGVHLEVCLPRPRRIARIEVTDTLETTVEEVE